MYTTTNFKTKKALKDAVKAGKVVTYYQPNGDMTGSTPPLNGRVFIEGPHYPEPHKWYAECEVRSGKIVRVK